MLEAKKYQFSVDLTEHQKTLLEIVLEDFKEENKEQQTNLNFISAFDPFESFLIPKSFSLRFSHCKNKSNLNKCVRAILEEMRLYFHKGDYKKLVEAVEKNLNSYEGTDVLESQIEKFLEV